MNIDIPVIGAIIAVASFGWRIIAGIKSELNQCYEREASQNQRIDESLHQIELLKYELEGHEDKYSLIFNGLKEKIEHNRARFREDVNRVGSKITQVDQQLGEIAKIVYKQD